MKKTIWTSSRAPLRGGGLALAMIMGTSTVARAVPPPMNVPTSEDEAGQAADTGVLGFLAKWKRSPTLLGNMWGLRTWLGRMGTTLAIPETSEVMDNATGGTGHGVDYDGLTQMVLHLDTQRAFDWYGGSFQISALQYHGRSLSADRL